MQEGRAVEDNLSCSCSSTAFLLDCPPRAPPSYARACIRSFTTASARASVHCGTTVTHCTHRTTHGLVHYPRTSPLTPGASRHHATHFPHLIHFFLLTLRACCRAQLSRRRRRARTAAALGARQQLVRVGVHALTLLYMCPHTTICLASSYYCVCVRILLYV
jgi:hypothetical protein